MTIFDQLLEQQKNKRKRPDDKEHRLQTTCVRWFRLQHRDMAASLFAVPNGGRRDKATGARLKAEGVVAGVSDLILLKQRGGYGALLIEMKTATGSQAKSQREWQGIVEADGYKYAVCRSLEDFTREVEWYLSI